MTTFFSNQQDSSINRGRGDHIRIQSGIWCPCQKQTLRQGFGFRRFVSEVIPEISVREWETAQGAELLTGVFVGSRGNERLHGERLLLPPGAFPKRRKAVWPWRRNFNHLKNIWSHFSNLQTPLLQELPVPLLHHPVFEAFHVLPMFYMCTPRRLY